MKYDNKQRKSEQSKLFLYNVPKKYTVDDIYHYFIEMEIDVIDLWQSSHKDARRKSFVALFKNIDIADVKSDRTLGDLGIKVRDYERKYSSF